MGASRCQTKNSLSPSGRVVTGYSELVGSYNSFKRRLSKIWADEQEMDRSNKADMHKYCANDFMLLIYILVSFFRLLFSNENLYLLRFPKFIKFSYFFIHCIILDFYFILYFLDLYFHWFSTQNVFVCVCLRLWDVCVRVSQWFVINNFTFHYKVLLLPFYLFICFFYIFCVCLLCNGKRIAFRSIPTKRSIRSCFTFATERSFE